MNHSLYFDLSNAKDVFNAFNSIRKKYLELNSIEFKKRKCDKLRAELESLEKQIG